MKKIVPIGFVIMVIALMVWNISFDVKMDKNGIEHLEFVDNISVANAEIDINWGQYYCVCKQSLCQDGKWISFRDRCGPTPSVDPVICPNFDPQCYF